MHHSAMQYGKSFFEAYCQQELEGKIVVDIGAQNVNGSLRDVCPTALSYIGVDFAEGNGVDVVLTDPYKLPFEDGSVDFVVCSSCFEHSEFFWLVFLEILRVLKPEGVFYLNVPSNGYFHQWPLDCWRFYPDAGHSLVSWGKRNGYNAALIESFIGEHSEGGIEQGGMWNDFVAVFIKDAENSLKYKRKIISSTKNYINGYTNDGCAEKNEALFSPDFQVILDLKSSFEAEHRKFEAERRIVQFKDKQIQDLYKSNSWRFTAPLRTLSESVSKLLKLFKGN